MTDIAVETLAFFIGWIALSIAFTAVWAALNWRRNG